MSEELIGNLQQIANEYGAMSAQMYAMGNHEVSIQYSKRCDAILSAINSLKNPTVIVKNELPEPVYYTMYEGGPWNTWRKGKNNHVAHSIKFSDGSIFDMVNGWRKKDNETQRAQSIEDTSERLVPRYPEWAGNDDPLVEKPVVSQDQRMVSRELLEKTLAFVLSCWTTTLEEKITRSNIITNLSNALTTEKKDLKAPPETGQVCGSYHAMYLNGNCSNCGRPKAEHKL